MTFWRHVVSPKNLWGTQTSSHSLKLETGEFSLFWAGQFWFTACLFPVCLLQPSLLGFQKPTRGARSEPCTSFGSRNTKGWVAELVNFTGFECHFWVEDVSLKELENATFTPISACGTSFLLHKKSYTKIQGVCRRLPVNPQWGKGNFGKIPRLQPPKLPSSKLT